MYANYPPQAYPQGPAPYGYQPYAQPVHVPQPYPQQTQMYPPLQGSAPYPYGGVAPLTVNVASGVQRVNTISVQQVQPQRAQGLNKFLFDENIGFAVTSPTRVVEQADDNSALTDQVQSLVDGSSKQLHYYVYDVSGKPLVTDVKLEKENELLPQDSCLCICRKSWAKESLCNPMFTCCWFRPADENIPMFKVSVSKGELSLQYTSATDGEKVTGPIDIGQRVKLAHVACSNSTCCVPRFLPLPCFCCTCCTKGRTFLVEIRAIESRSRATPRIKSRSGSSQELVASNSADPSNSSVPMVSVSPRRSSAGQQSPTPYGGEGAAPEWACASCTLKNPASNAFCGACGAARSV